ncbi:MAG: twin-arginine translocation signal domain-containing protein [Methylocella sp.]
MELSVANNGAIAPSRRAFVEGASAAAGAFILGSYIPFPKRTFAEGGPTQGPFDPLCRAESRTRLAQCQ